MRNKYIETILATLIMTMPCIAEENEIIISATRVAINQDDVASSVTVITAEDIEQQQHTTILDALKTVPGLTVAQSGGMGSTSDVFIRGAKSEQILVIIDGIEINDPIDSGRGADFANLAMHNIERIEVLRGSQSSLYGSDAIAGVISITTKKGIDKTEGYISLEAGSYNTLRESAGLSGANKGMNYSFSANRIDSVGFSAANEDDGNTEKDGFNHTSFSGRLGLTPSEIIEIDFFLKYIDSENEFDASGGPGGDAPDNLSTKKILMASSKGHISLFDSIWRQNIGVSIVNHERTSESAWGDSEFDSQMLKAEWQNDLYLGKAGLLTAGLEFEDEEGKADSLSKVSTDTLSIFAQDQLKLSSAFNVALGARLDSRKDFDEEITYKIAPVYKIKDTGTRLKATYGTGFKTPSLYQLYAPAAFFGPIGNEDLESEKSVSWDAGIEQKLLNDKVLIGITYFQNNFENMIDFVIGYQNISEAEANGIEFVSNISISDSLSIAANYTYLKTEDKDTGDDLIRRPKHSGRLGVNWRWIKNGIININLLYIGDRDDEYYDASMFGSVKAELDEYTVVNVATSYAVSEHLEIFGRIDNLFDEDYEEATGYGTPSLSGYAGIKASL